MHEVDQGVVVMYTLVTIFLFQFFFPKFYFFVYYVHEGYEGVCRVFTFEGACRVFTLRVYINRCIFFRIVVHKGRLIEKYMSLLFEEIPLSPKLKFYGENEVDIRNQRPRLRRSRLILVEKAGGICFRSTKPSKP